MDVYSSVKTNFYFSKCFGIAPYKLVGNTGSRKFIFSLYSILYSIFAINLIVFLYISYAWNFLTTAFKSSIIGSVATISLYADILLACFTILMSCLQSRKTIKFFSDIDAADKTLSLIAIEIPHGSARKYSIGGLSVTCWTISLAIIYVNVNEQILSYWAYVYMFIFFSTKIINITCGMNFVDCVLLLRLRFKVINAKLEEIVQSKSLSKYRDLDQLGSNRPTRDRLSHKMAAVIDTIQSTHGVLHDLVQDVHNIHGIQILLSIASLFVAFVINLNVCFFVLRKMADNPAYSARWTQLMFQAYVCCTYAGQMGNITLSCAKSSAEGNRTAVLVHQLMLAKPTLDEKTIIKLKRFSLQLLHHSFRFTACRFFAIDTTLLYAIVGGATTYLIILIQFQLAAGST